jgi:hypothetical protein
MLGCRDTIHQVIEASHSPRLGRDFSPPSGRDGPKTNKALDFHRAPQPRSLPRPAQLSRRCSSAHTVGPFGPQTQHRPPPRLYRSGGLSRCRNSRSRFGTPIDSCLQIRASGMEPKPSTLPSQAWPHSLGPLPPAPSTNLGSAFRDDRHAQTRDSGGRDLCSTRRPTATSSPPPPLAPAPLDAAIPSGRTEHNSRCPLAVT